MIKLFIYLISTVIMTLHLLIIFPLWCISCLINKEIIEWFGI